MAFWPESDRVPVQTNGNATTSAPGVSVASSGTPHVKGSWVQLVATTPFESSGIMLWSVPAVSASTADSSMLVDIALGAPSSELVIVSNWQRSHAAIGQGQFFPLRIPAGERIAARAQCVIASRTIDLAVILYGRGGWTEPASGGRATTYGADTATSNAVSLTDTASNNTKTSWTEVATATTAPMRWMIPIPGGVPVDSNWVGSNFLYDIGVGDSGSETAFISNLPGNMTTGEQIIYPDLCIPVNLPTGTRLSARFQEAVGSAEAITMSIIGVD